MTSHDEPARPLSVTIFCDGGPSRRSHRLVEAVRPAGEPWVVRVHAAADQTRSMGQILGARATALPDGYLLRWPPGDLDVLECACPCRRQSYVRTADLRRLIGTAARAGTSQRTSLHEARFGHRGPPAPDVVDAAAYPPRAPGWLVDLRTGPRSTTAPRPQRDTPDAADR